MEHAEYFLPGYAINCACRRPHKDGICQIAGHLDLRPRTVIGPDALSQQSSGVCSLTNGAHFFVHCGLNIDQQIAGLGQLDDRVLLTVLWRPRNTQSPLQPPIARLAAAQAAALEALCRQALQR